jgi:hypothetical protein
LVLAATVTERSAMAGEEEAEIMLDFADAIDPE